VASVPRRRVLTELARIFSTVCNPFLTALVLFVILAHALAHDTASFWQLLFLSTFFGSVGPMLYVFWLYETERISDLDMSVRAEREKVLYAFVVFYAAGTVTLALLHSPRLLTAALAGYAASSLLVLVITRYWKISTHALGITAPLVVLTALYGPQPAPFYVLIPIVGWSRVHLGAHTVAQVAAGTLLGGVSVWVFLHLFQLA
jgi:membrane-associated phospholipid phosphatase